MTSPHVSPTPPTRDVRADRHDHRRLRPHRRARYGSGVTLRLKHLMRLSRDVGRYALVNRVWWFVPLMALLALVMVAVTSTQAVVPVAVYTLF
jgi:hypothetical protein